MVRAIVFRILRISLFALSVALIGGFAPPSAFAAGDPTSVTLTGTPSTTGITACDTLSASHSCLGQLVDFQVEVINQNSAGNGSPAGTAFLIDENNVAIGSATLTPNGDGISSTADIEIATLTGATHTLKAQYASNDTSKWFGNATTTPWTVVGRPTTATVNTSATVVVGTSNHSLSASVTDAGPVPVELDKNGTQVAPGKFFMATNGTLPNPTVIALNTARYGAAAASLANGNVLVVGGSDGTNALDTAELIGVGLTTDTLKNGTNPDPRVFPTATLGKGAGNVFIAGGSSDTCLSTVALGSGSNGVLNSFQIYNVQAGTFTLSTTDVLATARCGHTATRMNDGRFLIAGGYDATGAALQSTEIFDGSQGAGSRVSAGPALAATSGRAGAVAVLLQNGSVLIAGGDASGDAEICDSGLTACTMLTAAMGVPRMFFAGQLMPDGNAIFAGGFSASDAGQTALSSAEIFDAVTGTFNPTSEALLNSAGTATGGVKESAAFTVMEGAIGFAGGRDDTNVLIAPVQGYMPAYTPAGVVNFAATDSSDDLGGTGNPAGVSCTLDVPNGTTTVACNTATVTSYHARHVNTGTHTVEGDYVGGANSAASTGTANVTVQPTLLSVTANPQSKAYGSSHSFSTAACTLVITAGVDCTASGLINGDSVTVTFASTANDPHQPVGTTAANIQPTSPAISPGQLTDYTFMPLAGDMTVTTASLNITANNDSKTYGDVKSYSAGSAAFSATGLQNGETIGSVTITDTNSGGLGTAAANGVYPLTPSLATGGTFNPGNYAITYQAGALTVNRMALTVTAAAKSKTYGDADPALTFTITTGNLVNGDTLSGALTRTPGEHVVGGPYAILQGSLAATSNYTLAYVGANLAITTRPITVTADPQTKMYGNADPTLTYQLTNGTLATGDAFSGTLTRAAGEHVATNPYQIQQGTLVAGVATDYNLTFAPANLTVTVRPISVAADPQTKTYGNADPPHTFHITTGSLGFSDTFSGALARASGEHVAGSPYAISQGTLVAGVATDYNLSFTGSNLSVTTRPVTVTADTQTKVYGNGDPALTFKVTSGSLGFADTFSGALTRVAGEHVAGSPYAIQQGTLVAATPTDYDLTYVPANLSVTLRPVTIAADAKVKTYGDADPALTFSITSGSLAFTDAFSGSLVRTTGELVAGSPYAIQEGSVALTADYSLTYAPGGLTINLRPLPIAAISGSKIYGTVPSFAGSKGAGLGQFSVSNLVNGDSVTSVALASAGQAANATVVTGGYAIVPSNPQGTGLANYSPVFTPGTLLVTPATPAMRAEQVSTKIDPATGGMVVTLKAFLFNSNAPGATQGTGIGTPTQTVDIFDGTTKLNSSPIALVANTTTGPCSSTNQNCGSEASFVTAPIQVAAGTLHKINVSYGGDTNFASASVQVGALAGAAANTFASSNVPPSTSTSVNMALPNPEPLLTGQSYTLKCKVFSTNTGVEQTAAICNPSSGTTAVTLPGNITIAVQTTTVTTTGELRMRGIYDLSFAVPAIVLVGAGLPLTIRRRIKGQKPLVWLGITMALVLCLVAVGCGGNGFSNPNKVPVATASAAQAGQYTVIITATNSGNSNSFDVATVPFTISQ